MGPETLQPDYQSDDGGQYRQTHLKSASDPCSGHPIMLHVLAIISAMSDQGQISRFVHCM